MMNGLSFPFAVTYAHCSNTEGGAVVSKSSSKIGAFFRHLPKAYRALVTTSTLLVACSLALFVFAVPPVLGEQSDGLFQNPLFGSADNQPASEAAGAGSDATSGTNTPGVASVIGAGVSAIGAAGPGGVTTPGTSAPAESGSQLTAQEAQSSTEGYPYTPAPDPSPSPQEEFVNDYNSVRDYYTQLATLVADSPIYWNYSPGMDPNCIRNWISANAAMDVCDDCIRWSDYYEHKIHLPDFVDAASESQRAAVTTAWQSLNRAAKLFQKFLFAADGCDDPGAHPSCFLPIVEGHMIEASVDGRTIYTLDDLYNVYQALNQV